jgi:hypothetical protein|tara:strand:- start:816 stop:1274 length:459 start_codon:yes stop_codon:yes gene_type:complete
VAYKGRFRPKHPGKYKGDPSKIIYRSLWEFKFFRYIDDHPDVLWWQSEEVIVPYMSPIDGKRHRYYPDVVVKKRLPDSTTETIMIEIKPYAQTRPPDIKKKNSTPSGRLSRRYINEVKTYGVNESKWKAARQYCADRGWKFEIFTEHELGIK